MAEIKSTRVAFVEALTEIMEQDERVCMVSADSAAIFRAQGLMAKYPERIIETGIAEGSAVMIAAGMASAGLKPYVCAYAGFLTMRACEQMRTFVGYPGLEVKFFGANAGMCSGEREGVTHQFFEDLGIMRAIPGYTVLAPADAVKGLEFDGVIVADAGEREYPARALDSKLLYVCLTRALHRMAVFYEGRPTPLLDA